MDKWLLCVVALILGMLMFHMLKSVCGCKNVVEGTSNDTCEKLKQTDCNTDINCYWAHVDGLIDLNGYGFNYRNGKCVSTADKKGDTLVKILNNPCKSPRPNGSNGLPSCCWNTTLPGSWTGGKDVCCSDTPKKQQQHLWGIFDEDVSCNPGTPDPVPDCPSGSAELLINKCTELNKSVVKNCSKYYQKNTGIIPGYSACGYPEGDTADVCMEDIFDCTLGEKHDEHGTPISLTTCCDTQR